MAATDLTTTQQVLFELGAPDAPKDGDAGTSTGGNTSTTLNDTTKAWAVNQWAGLPVRTIGGTGSSPSQTRIVTSNTATQLVVPTWTVTPDATTTYDVGGIVPVLVTSMSLFVSQTVLRRRAVGVSQSFTDTLDGSGSDKMVMKDWPITAVASVLVFGVGVPQSPDGIQAGFVFDERSIILLPNTSIGAPLSYYNYTFGRFPRARQCVVINYTAGYTSSTSPPTDASYNGAPTDLGAAVTFLVAQEYRRRRSIDQKTKTASMGEVVSFRDWEWPPWIDRTFESYRRHHYV